MIEDINLALDAFREFLGLVRDRQEKADEQTSLAFRHLTQALIETRAYLTRLAKEQPGDVETERRTSDHWMEASNAIRPIDADLAERCFTKAYGWADRRQFEQPEFQELPLSLDQIAAEIRQLINEKDSPVTIDASLSS